MINIDDIDMDKGDITTFYMLSMISLSFIRLITNLEKHIKNHTHIAIEIIPAKIGTQKPSCCR
jgi:hypothetical protein